MKALDDALGFTILDARVQQAHAELGADQAQRLGDVGRPEVDVVGPRQPVLQDRLFEA